MIIKTRHKPLSSSIGAAFIATLATSPIVNADSNPFAAQQLPGGYMVADTMGEGNCGGKKKAQEGNCGEGKAMKAKEGNCGEGKAMKTKEGNCGENKAMKKTREGSCGEGQCGSKK